MKKSKIGSFRQEACAGAPAPPRWNARSARVFGCASRTVTLRDRPDSIFSQLQGQGPSGPGWVVEQTHPGAPVKATQAFTPSDGGDFQERNRMCGIVGLLGKTPEFRERLGEMLTPMLVCMGDRGPDSAGLAIFSSEIQPPLRQFSLFSSLRKFDWMALRDLLRRDNDHEKGADIEGIENHAKLTTSISPEKFRPWLVENFPQIHLLAVGRSIELYKDEGHPSEIAARYRFHQLAGSHAVGHTRMATESAVTPAHAHPYTAGEDFCLVHNGSLSNPWSLRRMLEKKGIHFETDNDTEAACRYLEWRMSQGDTLEEALQKAFAELDGFYTLLMATAEKMVLVRDAFACKPAIIAETQDYVAVSSEFRSLAHLPGIQQARLFEPMPEEIYSWNV